MCVKNMNNGLRYAVPMNLIDVKNKYNEKSYIILCCFCHTTLV